MILTTSEERRSERSESRLTTRLEIPWSSYWCTCPRNLRTPDYTASSGDDTSAIRRSKNRNRVFHLIRADTDCKMMNELQQKKINPSTFLCIHWSLHPTRARSPQEPVEEAEHDHLRRFRTATASVYGHWNTSDRACSTSAMVPGSQDVLWHVDAIR